MPGRLEFEHEVDNDAEMVVKDFEFGMVWKYGGDEQPQVTKVDEDVKPELPDVEEEDELEVKLALLDIYFSKLDKREEAKDLIFDRGLTEHKRVGWDRGIADGRSKRWRGSDRKRSGSWSSGTRSLQSCKRLRTSRCC